MTWRLNWHAQLDPTYSRDTTSKGDTTSSITTNTCAKRMMSLAHCSLSTIITASIIPMQIRHHPRAMPHQMLNTQKLQIRWGHICKPTQKKRPQIYEKYPSCKNKIEVVTMRNSHDYAPFTRLSKLLIFSISVQCKPARMSAKCKSTGTLARKR